MEEAQMYRFRCLYLRDIWGYRDWVGFCVEGQYSSNFVQQEMLMSK
jgi:hypothetical protein